MSKRETVRVLRDTSPPVAPPSGGWPGLPPLRIVFAVPDHPWVDEGGADVRVAYTVCERADFNSPADMDARARAARPAPVPRRLRAAQHHSAQANLFAAPQEADHA